MFVVDELGVKIAIDNPGLLEKGLSRIESAVLSTTNKLMGMAHGVNALLAPLERFKNTAISAASSFESAFAEVKKTVDASDLPGGFEKIEQSIRDMAMQIPFAVEEIANVTAIGGQLGIPAASIEKFTKVILDMGVTTNMTTEEAATSMARLATIMKVPTDQFENLGSAINLLGSRGAATESEIVNMSLRMGAMGTKIGLLPQQVLSLAESLSSVGVQAELGGGVMTRMFGSMDEAVKGGGKKLDAFNKIIGGDFKAAFEKDAHGAILAVVQGLNRMDKAGENTVSVLKDAGLKGTGFTQVMSGMQQAIDKLPTSFATGAEGWSQSNLLADEAAKRYETFDAQMKIMQNNVRDVAITVGKSLVPIMQKLNFQMMSLLDIWKALNPQTQQAIIYAGALATALGSVLAVVGKINFALKMLGLTAVAPFLGWAAAIAAVVGGLAALYGWLSSGMSLADYWAKAQETLAGYAETAKGFIMNFQENMGILLDWLKLNWGVVWDVLLQNAQMAWDWLGRNWGNLLRDIVNLALTYWGNMATNYGVVLETIIRMQANFNGWLAGTMQALWYKVFNYDFLDAITKGLDSAWEAFKSWYGTVGTAFFNLIDKIGVILYEAGPILRQLLIGILTKSVPDVQAALAVIGNSIGTQFADELNAAGAAVEREGKMLMEDAKRGMKSGGSVGELFKDQTDIVKEQFGKMHAPLEGFKSSLEDLPEFKLPGLTTPDFNTDKPLTDTLGDEKVTDPLVDGLEAAGAEAVKTGEKIEDMLAPLRKEQTAIGWGSQEMWTAMFRQGLPAVAPQAEAGVDAAAAAMAEKKRINLAKRGIVDPRNAPVKAPGIDDAMDIQDAVEEQFGPLQTGGFLPAAPAGMADMTEGMAPSDIVPFAADPRMAPVKPVTLGDMEEDPRAAVPSPPEVDDEMATQTELLQQLVDNTSPEKIPEIVIDGPLAL